MLALWAAGMLGAAASATAVSDNPPAEAAGGAAAVVPPLDGNATLSSASRGHPVPNPDGPYLKNPCLNHTRFSKLPFCDPTIGLEARAADIIGRLTLTEKITALGSKVAVGESATVIKLSSPLIVLKATYDHRCY
jgi:hypothetical protein